MLSYKCGIEKCINSYGLNKKGKFKFSNYTTYGLGGLSDDVYFPRTPYEAKRACKLLVDRNKEFIVLGNGSNVLAADGKIDEAVICTREMSGIIRLNENTLLCLAGTKISQILAYCKNHALGGLEYLYGIPATIGGAVYMNAGVSGYRISDNVVRVEHFCGKRVFYNNKECCFGYRNSTMRHIKGLILSVELKVASANEAEIERRLQYFKLRRAHLPKGRSCGCVFKNGENYYSAELIEKARLKGFSIGGAVVSPEHANFIISKGGSAADVKGVINYVKCRVRQLFGVDLKEEVVYIGEFNDFNS